MITLSQYIAILIDCPENRDKFIWFTLVVTFFSKRTDIPSSYFYLRIRSNFMILFKQFSNFPLPKIYYKYFLIHSHFTRLSLLIILNSYVYKGIYENGFVNKKIKELLNWSKVNSYLSLIIFGIKQHMQ